MTISSLATTSTAISQLAAYQNLSKSSQTSQTSSTQDDSSTISDLGKLMDQLKTLQQSDPSKFKETTAQVATKLEDAAKQAADSGDSQQASALNDLASKFKTASETGEMPDLRPSGGQGGMQGAGGPGGPPPGPPPTDSDSDSTSSTSDSSTDSTTSTTAQLLKSYQSQSTDPMGVLTGILQGLFSSTETSSS